MNHINFDWFRPKNCHRHTPEEVIHFVSTSGLELEPVSIEDSGITVVTTRAPNDEAP